MIYEIRGKQVMLDSDLANLFNYETKQMNRQVQRNISRFPENYCFQLTEAEFKNLKCQNGTSSFQKHGGRRYIPYVFTEYGITMLAGILKSDIAIAMSIKIVNAFIEMRKYIKDSLIEQKFVNDMVFRHDYDIKLLQQSFDKLQEKEKTCSIFFEGQIYDAYSLLKDIFNKSKREIIIIDNYVDKNILDVLTKIDKKIIIITNKYNNDDYEKYKRQYSNVTLKINNKFHDRFIIIDKSILYHCGASFKDLGNKCFAINKMEDKDLLDKLIKNI